MIQDSVVETTSSSSPADGRRLRSARTRQSIIDAYVALVREHPVIPTATQIALRAGCSVRSIFERFPDLHALRVAATDHVFGSVAGRVFAQPANGNRRTRIGMHVEVRASTCEECLPLWRALNANKGDSAELRSRILLIRQMVAKRIELIYQPELATLGEVERRHTVITIDNLIDFGSWARMREDHGLCIEEACAVWVASIDRLLPPGQ